MKRIDKICIVAIFMTLGLWAVCWAADTELVNMTELDIGNADMLIYVVNDPNVTPVDRKIPLQEMLAYWTGSTAVTTLGTIGTGTWNASFSNDIVKDAAIDWGSGAGQVDLADIPGGISGASAWDFGSATSVEIPNAESSDATLTALGQVHIRGDEDRFSAHLGAGGEIAGEATISFVKSFFLEFDPGNIYDSNSIVPMPKISSKQYPNGIIIDAWEVNCHMNPDVEMNFNLGYSINPNDMADPNLIDILDTTAGQSSEDTDANINGGAAIPVNTYMMLYFDADPEGTCTTLSVQIWYHGEED